jgi:PLP dependent protein
VLGAIQRAADKAKRDPAGITLVAVSKGHSSGVMNAFIEAAHRRHITPVLGESYLQEFESKRNEVSPACFHFIGPLQRNKAKKVVELFSVIESVHSIALAERLQEVADRSRRFVEVFLQVNISGDLRKSGFSRDDIGIFLTETAPKLSRLRITGLMTIPKYYDNPFDVRPDFRALAELRAQLLSQDSMRNRFHEGRCALSMGMSRDFEIAIEEGADLVRVGSSLFGERAP